MNYSCKQYRIAASAVARLSRKDDRFVGGVKMANIKDLKRMCKSFNSCCSCPLFDPHKKCPSGLPDYIDEIVDEWVKEHPVKTYAQDFFEKFPNAPKLETDNPMVCVKHVYGNVDMRCCSSCGECWNQEMKENG